MKKILSGLLVFLLAVTMFADSKETVDGIIEVADGSKFPAGHFGQAAGYLPGDSVFVTNPESGVTLQFLNLGTLDSAEGVVILLSEESAKTLGIEKNAGMRCKLDMRYGSFDETVVGKAVIDSGDAKRVAKKAAPANEPVKEAAPVETEVSAEELVPEEVAEELPVAEAAPAVVAGVPLYEGVEADESEEEIVEEPAEETEETVVAVAEEEEEEPAEKTSEVAAAADEEEIIEEYENEGDYLETRTAVEQPSPAELAEVEENSSEDEEYAPIVLVPATPVVPEPVEETPAEPVAEETRSIVAEVVPVAEPEPVVVPEPAVVEPEPVVETRAVVPAAVSADDGWKSLIVESESKLARNCWYVQIASMNKEENIAACVKKYAKYPLALVPNGKGGYRVLVGPLNVDEYGAVLAKFRSFGYKDAFLKKR